ncbi:exosortase/archaeosortase family protein [Aquabacterium commune]|uniref:Exosortase/archaeosortase family protein n=1 Tax=Aquabacterium commune TaxID=70586 RepID=A0A4R6RFB5_9BURK|nr:archaeosortase/exosortase family protein [Aquabacterium commune]TDP84785.1 exosortase/archaeosortase family protein [Aquabacterium commune]
MTREMNGVQSDGLTQEPQGHTPARKHSTLWRAAIFIALFALLQGLYGAAKGSWVERLVVDHATVQTAAWLIDAVDPSVGVTPAGPRLRAPGGGINILNGCEGIEAAFMMVAAMLVAPLPLRTRVSGMLVGSMLVFVLNQARVVALFYAFRADKALFDMLHGIVAPMLLIIGAAAFFVIWLNRYAITPDVESKPQPV